MTFKFAYHYLFYKFYKFSHAAPSKWWSEGKATLLIAELEIFLIISILNYYAASIGWSNSNLIYGYLPLSMVAFLCNYPIFLKRNKWKILVEEFDDLPKRTNARGSWMVFGLVLFIVSNLMISFYLLYK